MPLRVIAEELKFLPLGATAEEELRACLGNLIIGVEQRHIELPRAERRLRQMAEGFNKSHVRDFRALLREHDKAMSAFGPEDHYHRPGPLNSLLDRPAVTIQANEDGLLGVHWLSPGVRASGADIEAAFRSGKCKGFVGAESRAIWLTPLTGEVAKLLRKAQHSFCTMSERASIARRLVALLGLSHIKPTAEILAMVTNVTISDLIFERPDDLASLGPAGSTAIEARGHRRFRAWPRHIAGPYGRTYDTDDTVRAMAGSGDFGALEAVCPRLPISAFRECIFLGPLTATTADDGQAYLDELDVANKTVADLLLKLADMIGL